MNRSVQDKFFEVLTRKASAHNLEVVMQAEWANQGVLHLQRPGSFETALSLPYSFSRRAYFGWQANRETHPNVFPERPNPKFAGFDPHELDQAVDAIIAYARSQEVKT